jgi:hypothetical protein
MRHLDKHLVSKAASASRANISMKTVKPAFANAPVWMGPLGYIG